MHCMTASKMNNRHASTNTSFTVGPVIAEWATYLHASHMLITRHGLGSNPGIDTVTLVVEQ